MPIRATVLLLPLIVPGLLGGWWLGWPGVALGVAVGACLMLAVDAWRARQALRWLRQTGAAPAPVLRGPWGQAVVHAARALRGARDEVDESTQRLEGFLAAIRASPDGVVLLDPQGCIEWCNAAARQHFDINLRRDRGQPIGNLVRDPAFAAHLAAAHPERDVLLAGRADAPGHPVRLSVQLKAYGAGHRLMLSRDVTTVAQADAMRRDFVANVSHELRTPLTVLAGFVETMQSLPLSEAERARYLALMATQSTRMQTLINDLLTLSRLEGSPSPSTTEVIDLPAMMAQCEAEAHALSKMLHPADEPPQALAFTVVPGLAITGASSEVRSAMTNLIHNAVRYTPAGGSIDIRWERLPDGWARLAVSDTGPGIAPQHLARLGERFYRVDRSRSRESGGTGLGLAITKHVVQRHGGELQVTSTLGQGSCFALLFPPQRVRT